MLQTIQHAHDVLTEKGLSPYFHMGKIGVTVYCPELLRKSYLELFSEWFPDMYKISFQNDYFTFYPKEQAFQKVANVVLSCVTIPQLESATKYAENSRYANDPVIASLIAKKAAQLI